MAEEVGPTQNTSPKVWDNCPKHNKDRDFLANKGEGIPERLIVDEDALGKEGQIKVLLIPLGL